MRSLPPGIDQRSPARHPDWLGPDDLSLKIQEIREATDYQIPIQLKLGAARVYDDVRMAAKCGPGHHLPRRRRGRHRRRAAHRHRGDGHPADGGDPRGAPRARGRGPGGRDRPRRRRRDPQRRRRGQVHLARREGRRDRPLGADGPELQQGDPGRHRLRGHDRRAGRAVLPLPHRPLPGRDHDAGPRAPQAPRRRRGRRARLQLPAHADARGADARARVREDERPLARARGPLRAHRRGGRDGEGAAGRDELHPGRHRGAALAEIKRLLEKHIDYPVDYLPDQPAEYAGAED